jgi:hypothetical protein
MSRQKSATEGGVRATVVMSDWKPAAIALSAADAGGLDRGALQPASAIPTLATTRAKDVFLSVPPHEDARCNPTPTFSCKRANQASAQRERITNALVSCNAR